MEGAQRKAWVSVTKLAIKPTRILGCDPKELDDVVVIAIQTAWPKVVRLRGVLNLPRVPINGPTVFKSQKIASDRKCWPV